MMIGSNNSVKDSSFCCLIAIYAAHLLIFHLFHQPNYVMSEKIAAVSLSNSSNTTTAGSGGDSYKDKVYVSHANDDVARLRYQERDGKMGFNGSEILDDERMRKSKSSEKEFELGDTMRYQMLASEQQQQHTNWESSINQPTVGYPKPSLDLSFFTSSISRVRNIFTSVSLSPSSWGIISGCAIFLLTYTDRDNNTLQHHAKFSD